jgi:multicomponent K+:H+ antiporter subunit A
MPALRNAELLPLPFVVLCAGALLQLVVGRYLSSRAKGLLAVLSSVPALIAVGALLPAIRNGNSFDLRLGTWDGPLAIVLHADALSALFALMGTLLGAIVLLYSIGYMAKDPAATRFYATMLLFIGGFVGLVFCANLLLLYLCWELIGLCSFSLVGFWYRQPEAVKGARKVLLMTHIAGYGLLAAVLVLYFRTGTAIWTDPAIAHGFSTGVFLLMLVALVGKSVQVPLHTWIPDAMAAPTPVSSLLHAACYVTAGVYLAARMHSFGPWAPAWNAILIVIATTTMLVGVMYAMVQSDLKRMLAFSTVSQIGYMLLGIGIGTPLGIMAGLLHCLNHGFFKGGLFLNAGAVQHAAGTRDMNRLGGLAARMPRTTLCWMVGVGNMAGIPLMSGFVSKWMLYAAALQAGWVIPAVVAWIASLGTVFICAKATSAVFFGPATEATHEAHEASHTMQWAMGLMALGSLVLGIAPQIAAILFFQPMLSALGLGSAVQVSWLGFFSGAGVFSTSGGLVLAVFSFLLGGAIFALARVSRTAPALAAVGTAGGALAGGGIFTGGEPLWKQDHLTASDFSLIFEQNWRGFFRWSNVDRAYAYLLGGVRAVAAGLAQPVNFMARRPLAWLAALSAALVLSIRYAVHVPVLSAQFPALPVPELLTGALCFAAVALVCAAAETSEDRFLPLEIAIVATLSIAGCIKEHEWPRYWLLEASAVMSVLPVWRAARTRSSRLLYLAVVALSGTCLGISQLLNGADQIDWSRAIFLTGICIKLAVIPFFFWILRLADELPAVLLGLIVAVIDMAAIGEACVRAQSDPNLLTPSAVGLILAFLTSLGAALLMVAQRHLKRLLVLSSIEDVGFMILGLSSFSTVGRDGVLLAAVTHSLAKSLLFISIATPEHDGMLDARNGGMAARYPFSAFAFVMGMFGMLGVPPLLGYAGRWRLYEAALSVHPALLAGFVAASILALIAYTGALTRFWWGPEHAAERDEAHGNGPQWHSPSHRRESWLVRAAMLVLISILAGAGFWPQFVLQAFQGGRP